MSFESGKSKVVMVEWLDERRREYVEIPRGAHTFFSTANSLVGRGILEYTCETLYFAT
jgi:hypothetical protein